MREKYKSAQLFGLVLSFLCFTIGFTSSGWTKIEFDSSQLVMKNADEISELVRSRIKKAQEIQAKQEGAEDEFFPEPEAVEHLRNATRIVLARPDQDGTRRNAFARLRRELVDMNVLGSVLNDLCSEAIAAIKGASTPPARAATYVILLENLMAEIKPEVKSNELFKKIITEIRDADLKISEKVRTQQLIRAMNRPVSPSMTATKILPKEKK